MNATAIVGTKTEVQAFAQNIRAAGARVHCSGEIAALINRATSGLHDDARLRVAVGVDAAQVSVTIERM